MVNPFDFLVQECWDGILSFLDISACGRLYLCYGGMDRLATNFWQRRFLEEYGNDFHFVVGSENPRQLLQRAVQLRDFAERKHQLLESHWCYPGLEGTNVHGFHFHFEDVLLNASEYDFYLRLRLENGRQLYKGFYPAERVYIDFHVICFELPRPTWRDLRRVQEYFDRRDFDGIEDEEPGTVVQDAWDGTSAVLVATKRDQHSSPVVVAAGFSYPHVVGTVPCTMDFGDDIMNMDAMTERLWCFLSREANDNDDLQYDLGFVADATSLKRFVLKDYDAACERFNMISEF